MSVLATGQLDTGNDHGLVVSPTEQDIAVMQDFDPSTFVSCSSDEEVSEHVGPIKVVDLCGVVTVLDLGTKSNGAIAFSADGTRLAFVGNVMDDCNDSGDLFLAAANGGDAGLVASATGVEQVRAAGDIVFFQPAVAGVFSVPFAGGPPVDLSKYRSQSPFPANALFDATSPDGHFIVASQYNLDAGALAEVVVDTRTGAESTLTSGIGDSLIDQDGLVFSADSRRLAYAHFVADEAIESVYDVATGAKHDCTIPPVASNAALSSDGALVAYSHSLASGASEVVVAEVDSGMTWEVPGMPAGALENGIHGLFFSPDASWVFIVADALYAAPSGGQLARYAFDAYPNTFPVEVVSPDSRYLAASDGTNAQVIDLSAGSVDLMQGSGFLYEPVPTGARLAVLPTTMDRSRSTPRTGAACR